MYTTLLPIQLAILLGGVGVLFGSLWMYVSIGLARSRVTKRDMLFRVMPAGILVGLVAFCICCLPGAAI